MRKACGPKLPILVSDDFDLSLYSHCIFRINASTHARARARTSAQFPHEMADTFMKPQAEWGKVLVAVRLKKSVSDTDHRSCRQAVDGSVGGGVNQINQNAFLSPSCLYTTNAARDMGHRKEMALNGQIKPVVERMEC